MYLLIIILIRLEMRKFKKNIKEGDLEIKKK